MNDKSEIKFLFSVIRIIVNMISFLRLRDFSPVGYAMYVMGCLIAAIQDIVLHWEDRSKITYVNLTCVVVSGLLVCWTFYASYGIINPEKMKSALLIVLFRDAVIAFYYWRKGGKKNV